MDLLLQLQQIPGPAGDEGRIADFVEAHAQGIDGATVRRVNDLVWVTRGTPRVAVVAHTDTIGFTLGYDRHLIPLGGPRVEGGELLREAGGTAEATIKVKRKDDKPLWRLSGKTGEPGSRWVFAAPLKLKGDRVTGPYLDNRAGVWNALRVLERCPDVAVFFTPSEEHTGRGALLAARLMHEELQIGRALISDITWHTDWIKIGKGPAVSLRDRFPPRQSYLDAVLEAAAASGLPFQREVEREGGSDGASIERSSFPIDWVFIGAPQKRPHTPREECRVSDLRGMVALYEYLVPALSR
jgi:putative aminopeptidase FrvX